MRSLDRRLLRVARTYAHSPRAELAVERFSKLGERGAVWLALGACGYAANRSGPAHEDRSGRNRAINGAEHAAASDLRAAEWRRATATVACVYGLNTLVKLVVRRPRPNLPGLAPLTSTPTQLSFPSAHSATSFAGALAYARLGAPAPALYALAGSLALSRLYLGVHYPSDVLAGALLGTAVAARCAPTPTPTTAPTPMSATADAPSRPDAEPRATAPEGR
ncbi:MAG TPA: phosphatase PAP2 family protein [Solirubrobacteraceae bacterium]|nr:phosphatase PAP2 family protein [Solirubrobacteraceae bacterium]